MPQHEDDEGLEFVITGSAEWLDRVMARFENVQISDFEDMNTVNRPAYSPTGKVYLPANIYAALEQIRLSGETNMADLEAIKRIAHRRGLPEVATWLDENSTIWWIAFRNGAEPLPEDNDERS